MHIYLLPFSESKFLERLPNTEFQGTHFCLVSLSLERCHEENTKLNATIPQFTLCLKRPGLFLLCTLLYQQSHAEANDTREVSVA